MNLSQRQNEILRILKEKKYLSVEELSSALSVSKVTIRSDLTALEEKGAVTRTHGGVMIAEVAPRIVSNSLTEHEAEKKSIGKTAAALIPDDAVIIIDSGSTTVRIAEFLSDKNLTVVTNSFLVADILRSEKNIELMMLGGSFVEKIGAQMKEYVDAYIKENLPAILEEEINKESLKKGVVSDILMEVNIADEETKSGMVKRSILWYPASG